MLEFDPPVQKCCQRVRAGVIALLVAMTAAFFLRRFPTKSADSPGKYKLFGWFQAGLGTLCVLAYVVGADGKHLRRVTDTPVGMRFQWSPNGKQFLFQSSYEDVRNRGKDGVLSSAIYVIRADGKNRQRLAKQIGNVSGFAVFPRR